MGTAPEKSGHSAANVSAAATRAALGFPAETAAPPPQEAVLDAPFVLQESALPPRLHGRNVKEAEETLEAACYGLDCVPPKDVHVLPPSTCRQDERDLIWK